MDQRNAASRQATPREHSHRTSLAVQGRLDRDPDRLKALARRYKYNDLFTAELAAWCAEVKAKRFKNTLAELANADARLLPLELHDFVWEVLSNGTTPLAERVANVYTTLSSA
jgi:hypothetical protein